MYTSIATIPFDPERELFDDEGFRKFLLNKKVKRMAPEFFQAAGKAYWTVFVEYEPVLPDDGTKKKRIELNEPQRLLLDRLRVWRKEKAEREGIPVFIIATNSELLDVVRKAPRGLEALGQIKGFGKKKLERHGKEIVDMIQAFYARTQQKDQNKSGVRDETGKQPVPEQNTPQSPR